MRYLGGKSRLAKRIAEPINSILNGRPLWEPFCGGLGMSAAWAQPSYLLLTDACVPLISLYKAFDAGWMPPLEPVLAPERDAALALPDTDPRKAFLRFGCGFGGVWGGGTTLDGMSNATDSLAEQSCRSLARTFAQLGPHAFDCVDFCSVEPYTMDGVIYCDPPYQHTFGYAGKTAGRSARFLPTMVSDEFDHELFYERVIQWAELGADVFISEFQVPEDVGTPILEMPRKQGVGNRAAVVERLYWVEP